MNIEIKVPIFVGKESVNDDIRKVNDVGLYVLLDKDEKVISLEYATNLEIKKFIRSELKNKFETDIEFHLEQVYTLADPSYSKDGICIFYVALINENNLVYLKDCKLKKIDIGINDYIKIGDNKFRYSTKQNVVGRNIEYIHNFNNDDKVKNLDLISILTSFKYLKSRLDISDILFKLLPERFTLEYVRLLYEKLKGKKVDKSNFRKKIMQYCVKLDEIITSKGYRPSNVYSFKADLNDLWI